MYTRCDDQLDKNRNTRNRNPFSFFCVFVCVCVLCVCCVLCVVCCVLCVVCCVLWDRSHGDSFERETLGHFLFAFCSFRSSVLQAPTSELTCYRGLRDQGHFAAAAGSFRDSPCLNSTTDDFRLLVSLSAIFRR